MSNELVTKVFNGNEVEIIIGENGEPLFELYSTGMALGQVKESKGILYPRKDRINKNVINAEISTVVHNGKQYLDESKLYDLMLEVKTDKVKPFRRWIVNDVLPSIRKHGAYMTENTIEKALTSPDFLIQLATKLKEEQEARRLAELEKEKAYKVIEIQSEKVGLYEDFASTDKLFTVKQVADSFAIKGLGRNNFFEWLRNKNIFSNCGINKYSCYRQYIESGYFVTRTRTKTGKFGQYEEPYSLFTIKGIQWIYKKLKNDNYFVSKTVDEIVDELFSQDC